MWSGCSGAYREAKFVGILVTPLQFVRDASESRVDKISLRRLLTASAEIKEGAGGRIDGTSGVYFVGVKGWALRESSGTTGPEVQGSAIVLEASA
jgi:hypothetical protein